MHKRLLKDPAPVHTCISLSCAGTIYHGTHGPEDAAAWIREMIDAEGRTRLVLDGNSTSITATDRDGCKLTSLESTQGGRIRLYNGAGVEMFTAPGRLYESLQIWADRKLEPPPGSPAAEYLPGREGDQPASVPTESVPARVSSPES